VFTTVIFGLTFLGGLVGQALLWALCLWIGALWAKIAGITFRRALFVTVVNLTAQLLLLPVILALPAPTDPPIGRAILGALLGIASATLVPWLLIATLLRARFLRAIQAWLPTLLDVAAAWVLVLLVIRPFLFEAFSCPTNSMAPTLLGRHWSAPCRRCGKPAYCSVEDPRWGRREGGVRMICEDFHTSLVDDASEQVHAADRFCVAKFLRPRRWDLVVFRYPEDPGENFVKRLVGLPGEEVIIKEGRVWIDGQPLTPPEAIRGIEYLSELEDFPVQMWGTPEKPARLGADEYFVLGDFSAAAKDSRLWKKGAPGHNPYAVPASYMIGVVTHIYWPPSRWRIIR
jgi:signal peptidase I